MTWMRPGDLAAIVGLPISTVYGWGHFLDRRGIGGGRVEYDVSPIAHLLDGGRWLRVEALSTIERAALDAAGIEPWVWPPVRRPQRRRGGGPWTCERDLARAAIGTYRSGESGNTEQRSK